AVAIEPPGIQVVEQLEHQPVLGAEVIVDLAQRHAGRLGHIARAEARMTALAQHLLGRLQDRGAGLDLLRQGTRHSGPPQGSRAMLRAYSAGRGRWISESVSARALRPGSGISIETCWR